MLIVITEQWESLESWRTTALLVAGVIFVADAALVGYNVALGTEQFMEFGQALVGAGWTAAFLGLLGFYPDLSSRSHRPSRIGAVFAALGAIVVAVMALTALTLFLGVLGEGFENVGMYFLPPVFFTIVLGFGLFGVVVLRTNVYARGVGLLFLLLPVTFLFNLGTGISGVGTLATVLVVVCVLALTNLAISYLLRTGTALADRGVMGAPSDPTG